VQVSHDPIVRLDLPEQGALQLPLAGIGSRGLATLIDLVWLAAGPLLVSLGVWLLRPSLMQDAGFRGILFAVGLLLPCLGPLAFELWQRGQSPGKRQVGIRVVSLDGHAVTSNQLLLRNVLRLVDFLPAGYLFGTAALFVSARGQRLGDVVAGTLVVREGRRALEDVTGLHDHTVLPRPEYHAIPPPLLTAVRLLLDPTRRLNEDIRVLRRSELVRAVRAHRPDLAAVDDAELWSWLEKGVRE